jgi:hypothetical protein
MEESYENVDMLVCRTSWLRKFKTTNFASFLLCDSNTLGWSAFNESVRFAKDHAKIMTLAKSFLLQSSNEPLHLDH